MKTHKRHFAGVAAAPVSLNRPQHALHPHALALIATRCHRAVTAGRLHTECVLCAGGAEQQLQLGVCGHNNVHACWQLGHGGCAEQDSQDADVGMAVPAKGAESACCISGGRENNPALKPAFAPFNQFVRRIITAA